MGCGNSTSKKDAQTNAAKDFIQFLIRTGRMGAAEVPEQVLAYTPPTVDSSAAGPPGPGFQPQQQRPVFKEGYGPQDVGQSYRYHLMIRTFKVNDS